MPDAPSTHQPLRRDVIVIGASAGGVQVLLDLAAGLPLTFPAAILVVLHIGAHRSLLPELMRSNGANPAVHATDALPLEPGTIYVAPPDHHMLVCDGLIRLQRGPKEHHARPAIDPLFRAAALEFGSRVVGVLLSGRLDDGVAGLQAIKACGGTVVVQDPATAEQPDMPRSALANVAVDHCVQPERLAETLMALVQAPAAAPAADAVSLRLVREQDLTLGKAEDPMDILNALGTRSGFVCPDCAGALWKIEDSRPERFRCHTGHGFSLRTLADTQALATDQALWSAIRALNEHEQLLRKLAESDDNPPETDPAQLQADAERIAEKARQLRNMVSSE